MWHWQGRGTWVLWSAVCSFGATWLLQKYVLASPLPNWMTAVNLSIAGLICIAVGVHARLDRSGKKVRDTDTGRLANLPPQHTLQGLSITTWGVLYLAVAAFTLWMRT